MGEKKTLDALIDGGKATGGPPLGPVLGPLGVNVLAIVNKINELTKDYAGMKVPVKIIVDTETKQFEINVGTPTTSALIVKELGVEKGSGNPLEEKIGDLKMDSVIKITNMKRNQLLSGNLKSAVKEILGCCTSLGVTVEGKEPKDVQKEIDNGDYDHLFKE